MAYINVLITVVTRMASHEPICLLLRNRKNQGCQGAYQFPLVWHSWHHPQFFAFTQFLLKRPKVISGWKLSLSLSWSQSIPCSQVANSGIFHWLESPCFGVPGHISWPASYIKFLRWAGYISIFWGRGKAKKLPEESSPLLQSHTPCFSSHVVKISTPIVLHGPSWRKFPGKYPHRFSDRANFFRFAVRSCI